jgi:hypothetical protein
MVAIALYFALFELLYLHLQTSIPLAYQIPVESSAVGALFGFLFWRYGSVSALKSTLGGVILWIGLCAQSFGFAIIYLWVGRASLQDFKIVTADFLTQTVVTLTVASAICPTLRKRRYWLVALIVWSVPFAAVGILMAARNLLSSDAAVALPLSWDVVVFVCLGYWLSQGFRSPLFGTHILVKPCASD